MSASQSKLESAKYGYDMVVATTQLGINSTMKGYLLELEELGAPVVTCCYIGDKYSSQPIDHDRLLELSKGSDPFSVPDGADPAKDPDLLNLAAAGFVYAFRFQIGLPLLDDPMSTPDIIKLGRDVSSVQFNLLCSVFDVCGFNPGYGWYPVRTWSNLSQPDDVPWYVMTSADLRQETVPPAQYGTLPAAVQQQATNTVGPFSVQSLLLDLDTAATLGVPDVDNGQEGPLHWMLQDYFLPVYSEQLKTLMGNPVIGCTIVQQPAAATTTELPITSMSLEISPPVAADGTPLKDPTPAQQQITTLNYLCATDNHKLPAANPFAWNWVDETETGDYDGVVAINRASLVEKIKEQMLPSVLANCYQPHVRVSIEWTGDADIEMDVKPGGQPIINTDALQSGIPGTLQVLTFAYHGHDQDAGDPSWYGTASLDTWYQAVVRFGGNVITVEQFQQFDAVVTRTGSTTSGTPINIHRVDLCTISVDDHGQLIATMDTVTPATNSASSSTSTWWGDLTGGSSSSNLYSSTAAIVGGTVGTMLNILPFTIFQYLVFPGGQSFSYDSAGFATGGDLVSHIVFTDPGSGPDIALLPGEVASGTDRIYDGQWLGNDGYLASKNGKYAAYLQDDGNLVLMHAHDGIPDPAKPYWSIFGNATDKIVGRFTGVPCYASMQCDGNFVLYNGRSPLTPGPAYWAINKGLPSLTRFVAVMEDNADFVVYRPDGQGNLTSILFQTGTDYISKQG